MIFRFFLVAGGRADLLLAGGVEASGEGGKGADGFGGFGLGLGCRGERTAVGFRGGVDEVEAVLCVGEAEVVFLVMV